MRKAFLTIDSRHAREKGLTVAGMVGWLLVWAAVSNVTSRIPSPLEVLATVPSFSAAPHESLAVRTIAGTWKLTNHAAASAARIVSGFGAGAAAGIAAAFVLLYWPTFYHLLIGVIDSMRPVPPVALVPFFIILFGFAESARLLLVGLGVGLVMFVGTIEAVRQTPRALIESHLTLGLNRTSMFRHVIIPYGLSRLLGTGRVALALSVGLVVVSEFMGAAHGLGYIINVAKVSANLSVILLIAFFLGAVAAGLDRLLQDLVLATMPWSPDVDLSRRSGVASRTLQWLSRLRSTPPNGQ